MMFFILLPAFPVILPMCAFVCSYAMPSTLVFGIPTLLFILIYSLYALHYLYLCAACHYLYSTTLLPIPSAFPYVCLLFYYVYSPSPLTCSLVVYIPTFGGGICCWMTRSTTCPPASYTALPPLVDLRTFWRTCSVYNVRLPPARIIHCAGSHAGRVPNRCLPPPPVYCLYLPPSRITVLTAAACSAAYLPPLATTALQFILPIRPGSAVLHPNPSRCRSSPA